MSFNSDRYGSIGTSLDSAFSPPSRLSEDLKATTLAIVLPVGALVAGTCIVATEAFDAIKRKLASEVNELKDAANRIGSLSVNHTSTRVKFADSIVVSNDPGHTVGYSAMDGDDFRGLSGDGPVL